MAHPAVTREWGTRILEKTDYMFISVTALADQSLETAIEEATAKHGTRAFVPHGGVVGHGRPPREPGRVGRAST